ncbi:MAG: hypothetical protein JXA49_04205 [Actinobacteria bacterium]|nr:hypothetical protein [Actinomycetota bacterium]
MNKPLKITLIAVLVLLTGFSGALLVFTATRPSAAYDAEKVKLDIDVHARDEILTCAYKVYSDNSQNMWVAKTIIRNEGDIPVYDFNISYKISNYTDWTSGEEYKVIRPGQTVRDYCWPALDAEEIKAITTKTPVELIMKYEFRGMENPVEKAQKIYFLGKNDFTFTSLAEEDRLTFTDQFDNYRFLASFITPNEETTKAYANQVASGLETNMNDDDAYQAFINCFNSLRDLGVRYIQEPAGFWTGSESQYIQYPKETLDRKSGTCIDLAIAMSAIMEAVGVRSYVALIPGHAIPMIELPQSGDVYAIESTFIDKEYCLSHFPGETSPDVTATECINIAKEELDNAEAEGSIIVIDPEYWWKAGVMPAW